VHCQKELSKCLFTVNRASENYNFSDFTVLDAGCDKSMWMILLHFILAYLFLVDMAVYGARDERVSQVEAIKICFVMSSLTKWEF
jgi:hypothetical protein